MLPAGIMAAAHSLGSQLTAQQGKALQAASQCLASGWACGRRPQCWACGRHPCGIARDKVDGPVAVVRNVGGTKIARVQMALDGDEVDDDDDRDMFCIPPTLWVNGV